MVKRKLDPEIREHLKKLLGGYSIPALTEVLGILWEEFERRGVTLEVLLDGEQIPL